MNEPRRSIFIVVCLAADEEELGKRRIFWRIFSLVCLQLELQSTAKTNSVTKTSSRPCESGVQEIVRKDCAGQQLFIPGNKSQLWIDWWSKESRSKYPGLMFPAREAWVSKAELLETKWKWTSMKEWEADDRSKGKQYFKGFRVSQDSWGSLRDQVSSVQILHTNNNRHREKPNNRNQMDNRWSRIRTKLLFQIIFDRVLR